MSRTLISIIVCTYNRANSLVDTLAALSRQEVPPGIAYETILVDNNSSDNTKEIADRFTAANSAPYLRYFFEPKQGLSHARNRGIAEAQGEFILFTDDDVSPESDWLATLYQSMTDHDCDGAGGWIGPTWEIPPPKWLTEIFFGFLAIRTDSGEPKIIKAESEPPFGANMGFKRQVFETIGTFDPELGRKGDAIVAGEEWDLFQRLLANGGKVMYFPAAKVHHKVPASRMTKAYFRRWRFEESRNQARRFGVPGDRTIFGIPLYIIPQTLRAALTALKARFTEPQDRAFLREMILWSFFGTIAGLRQRSANP